jgi:hypothetical protein
MAHKQFDPLDVIPSSDVIRRQLTDTERLASRLRILLETAERIETTQHVGAASFEVREERALS